MLKFPFAVSHFTAAIAAVLVSYGSAAVIIYQAAQAFGASDVQITSWFTSLGLVCGILSILLSYHYRSPIMISWCTPGAAMMVGLTGVSLSQGVAAFIFAGTLMFIVTATGLFERLVKLIPSTLASAMLAGILINFGSRVFASMQTQTILVGLMLLVYLLSQIRLPRYVILLMLLIGSFSAWVLGEVRVELIHFALPSLTWVTPEWHWGQMIGVGIPLFIASLTTQNVPGLAIMRAYGYHAPAKPIVASSALATMIFAPLGIFMANLAAISAAICMGSDVDKDPKRRYLANVLLGFFYLLLALAGGTVVSLFAALPLELLAALAGIAVFSTLQANLVSAFREESTREASLITLLTSASGLSLLGVSSAFWGLVFGVLVYHLNHYIAQQRQA